MGSKNMNVELHIERLVLHDFNPEDRLGIQTAVCRELTRLFSERGFEKGISAGSLNGGEFDVSEGAKPEAVGAQVAQNIYGGLRGE